MKNFSSEDCPCKKCITFAICKNEVDKYASEWFKSYYHAYCFLSKKCHLLQEYIEKKFSHKFPFYEFVIDKHVSEIFLGKWVKK